MSCDEHLGLVVERAMGQGDVQARNEPSKSRTASREHASNEELSLLMRS